MVYHLCQTPWTARQHYHLFKPHQKIVALNQFSFLGYFEMFSANGSSRAYGRLTSKLRRLALGTAYALRPRRISVLPAVAASVVRTSVGLERRDACLVIDDPQPRHPLGFVGICGDLDPDSLMQGFRRGLYPFSHVGRKKWWMLPQRMSLAPRLP